MDKHAKCIYYFLNLFPQIKTQTWCFRIYSLWSWNMRWAFTRISETVKEPVLFYALVWFSHARGPHTFIGRGKSPFHPRSRCFVSAWVLDLCKNTGWLQAKKFHFSRWQFIQLTLIPLTDTWVSTLWHQSFSCLFFTFDETISYWILCSLRSASYKIIVPPAQLAIKWFTQMTKTPKTFFFFICYHPSPRQPAGKVQSFGLEGWGYSEGGQIKTNFSLFSFLYMCVYAKSFWPRETITPVVCLSVFFFFCWCNVSQVLYIIYINC